MDDETRRICYPGFTDGRVQAMSGRVFGHSFLVLCRGASALTWPHPCVKSAWSAQSSTNMQITTTDVAQLVGALLKSNFGGTWQTRSRTDQRIWSGVSLLNHSRAIRKIKLISDGCCGSAGKSPTNQLPLSHIDPKPPGSRPTQTIHPLSESSWMETLGGCAILGPQTAKSKPCQVACLAAAVKPACL